MSFSDNVVGSALPAQSLQPDIANILTSTTASLSTLPIITPSSVLSAMASVTASTAASGGERPGAEHGECKLLGPFALLIQGALGLLALLSLVFKRWRERPQRPVKIWAFDASKQVVGSSLLHVANLLMSIFSSGGLTIKAGDYEANPCSFYLLNLGIDTTLGIPILIVLLRLVTHAFSLTPFGDPPESIQSGNYGRPPKAKWWLKQSFIYFLGLLGMKFCVFIIFQLCPWIIRVGDWALRWTEGDERLQVFFVMLFFPVVMNALQYYIIDGFIKNQNSPDHEPTPSEDGEVDPDEATPNRSRQSQELDLDGVEDCHDVEVATKDKGNVGVSEDKNKPKSKTKQKEYQKKLDEYDPTTDGDGEGSGSSRNGEPHDTVPKSPDMRDKANDSLAKEAK